MADLAAERVARAEFCHIGQSEKRLLYAVGWFAVFSFQFSATG